MLDYGKYITVANRYQRKAKYQDREDLNHDIIIALAEAQRAKDSNGSENLSDIAMLRIASYECQKYWRQVRRQNNISSLNTQLDNVNADGNISDYYPDFFVKLSDKQIYIVETKGQEDLDVPLKMQRLRQWCEDINQVQSGVTYNFVYVDMENFERYKPASFRQLTEILQEYQKGK